MLSRIKAAWVEVVRAVQYQSPSEVFQNYCAVLLLTGIGLGIVGPEIMLTPQLIIACFVTICFDFTYESREFKESWFVELALIATAFTLVTLIPVVGVYFCYPGDDARELAINIFPWMTMIGVMVNHQQRVFPGKMYLYDPTFRDAGTAYVGISIITLYVFSESEMFRNMEVAGIIVCMLSILIALTHLDRWLKMFMPDFGEISGFFWKSLVMLFYGIMAFVLVEFPHTDGISSGPFLMIWVAAFAEIILRNISLKWHAAQLIGSDSWINRIVIISAVYGYFRYIYQF